MKGLIFRVLKYSVHDGPGIRVTFFMKGCPLNCLWCHNPEGISPVPQKAALVRKIGGKEFTEMTQAGEYYSVESILEILDREKIFLEQSHGGVTFSGGEPLFQPEFLLEALRACKGKGYHTAVDTSGYAREEDFKAVIPYTDLFLFDLKHLDEPMHSKLTGISNKLILSNFILLVNSGKEVIVRFPVVPGCNDDLAHLAKLRSYLTDNRRDNLKKICLLPFHKTGMAKYRKFGIEYKLMGTEQPTAERMNDLKQFFAETGIKIKIGG